VASPFVPRARELLARARNAVVAPRFARSATARDALPVAGADIFFATDPSNLYQFEQWRRPLEELAGQLGVYVIVDRPDTGAAIQTSSQLPVTYARSSAQLEDVVARSAVRVVLYLNQVDPNFRMLRFAAPVHVQIGHGDSDKGGSVSNQHKAYDVTFVGGQAGRDRLAALRCFDVDQRTRTIGRPQLDFEYPGAPPWRVGDGIRVFYAPTWEGDRPSIAYGSLASHGLSIVEALLVEPSVRVIYRPHPRTGTASAAHDAADRAIRRRLRAAGSRHWIDDGEYGWQWSFADACVTDISAVAYDWLATGKPLVVTAPADKRADVQDSPLLARVALLEAAAASSVVERLRAAGLGNASVPPTMADLRDYYFGEVADRASTRRFCAAVLELARR
jgi:hypothetical protein